MMSRAFAARCADARRLAVCLVAGSTLSAAITPAAFAEMIGPADTNPANVESGAYSIEPSHTQVLFSVSHMGFSTYYGQLSKVSGSMNLDAKAPSRSSFEIHVPVNSISTTSSTLNTELKSNAWLDAKANPEMVFKSTTILPTGNGYADITGNLTLHGVTRPIVLKAKLVGAGINPLDKKYTVGFDLNGTIMRSHFGITTYVPLIGDAVTVTIAGVFEKQG